MPNIGIFEILFLMVVSGALTSIIAQRKSRNPVGWFFVGFFFFLLGIIVAIVIPSREKAVAEK